MIAALSAALIGIGVASAPAQATVTNYRSTGTCTLAGTVWNLTDLYHRDSATGNVQSFGFAFSRKSGTGKISELQITWSGSSPSTLWYGIWPTGITSIGDTSFTATPSWQASQSVYYNITSPSSSGNQTTTCAVNVT
jgi:hypothetical protein